MARGSFFKSSPSFFLQLKPFGDFFERRLEDEAAVDEALEEGDEGAVEESHQGGAPADAADRAEEGEGEDERDTEEAEVEAGLHPPRRDLFYFDQPFDEEIVHLRVNVDLEEESHAERGQRHSEEKEEDAKGNGSRSDGVGAEEGDEADKVEDGAVDEAGDEGNEVDGADLSHYEAENGEEDALNDVFRKAEGEPRYFEAEDIGGRDDHRNAVVGGGGDRDGKRHQNYSGEVRRLA